MTLQTATKSQRAVCFSPEKRPLLHTLQQTKSPVKITNFRTSDNYSKDIVIDKKTVISPIPKDDSFTYKEANQESVLSIASLQEAASEQLVSVKAKVINIQSPKVQPTSSFGPLKKQECTIVDSSKSIQLILWQQNVEMLQLNNTYLFKGLRLKEGPSGNKYLNTPRGVLLWRSWSIYQPLSRSRRYTNSYNSSDTSKYCWSTTDLQIPYMCQMWQKSREQPWNFICHLQKYQMQLETKRDLLQVSLVCQGGVWKYTEAIWHSDTVSIQSTNRATLNPFSGNN